MPHSESPMAEVLQSGVQVQNRELVVGRPDGTRVRAPSIENDSGVSGSSGGLGSCTLLSATTAALS